MATTPSPGPIGLPAAPDEVLADRAADGDRRAFAVVVQRYERLLRGYAIRVLGTASGADDVVQEAFVTAWQQLDDLQDRAALRAWLIRITTRKALDHARATRPYDDVGEIDLPAPAAGTPEARSEAASLQRALAAALAALPETQRRAWLLREIAGYRYDEIARELDVPTATVRGALARARRTLLLELDAWR